DGSILQHHAGDRDALALPAGKLDAALAYVRQVSATALPVLQAEYEFMRLRLVRRRAHLLVARAGPPVTDVCRDGAMQERGVLRHHADRRAQAFLRGAGDVLAVDAD